MDEVQVTYTPVGAPFTVPWLDGVLSIPHPLGCVRNIGAALANTVGKGLQCSAV